MGNLYKKLWSRIGGRPWTYIIRDWWLRYEILWIVSLILLGVYFGHAFDWRYVLSGVAIFTFGYIAGHLFWGTKYIQGQGGSTDA